MRLRGMSRSCGHDRSADVQHRDSAAQDSGRLGGRFLGGGAPPGRRRGRPGRGPSGRAGAQLPALDRPGRDLAAGGTREPRRIMLAEPTCTAGCRGALYVTVRCEGERVIWDAWENTSDATALPADMAFDAGQYEAELARAAADRDWEEPVDTLARSLGQAGSSGGAASSRASGHDAKSPTSPENSPLPRGWTSSSATSGRRENVHVPTCTNCSSPTISPSRSRCSSPRPASWRTIHGRPPSHETAEGWVQERLS